MYAQDIEMDVIPAIEAFKNNVPEKYETISELLETKGYETMNELLAAEGQSSALEYMMNKGVYIQELEEELRNDCRSYYAEAITDNNQNTESVNKYGGFYIARYEAGDGTTGSARTNSTSDSNTLVSKKGAYVYNYVDLETSKTLSTGLKGSNTSVTSQLITGAGWDRTLNWIIETGGKTENEVIKDSRSWGNYYNSTGNAAINSGTSNMNYTTGRSEYWKANNIYNLAGNTSEWTQEQSATDSVYRGGDFFNDGVIIPVSHRNNFDSTDQNNCFSFRVQLYINV